MHSDNNSVNSLEYWSDEEGRYPPQMSLSPIPGEAKFRKTTPKPKDAMKYSRIIAEVIRHFVIENVKQAWIVGETARWRIPVMRRGTNISFADLIWAMSNMQV